MGGASAIGGGKGGNGGTGGKTGSATGKAGTQGTSGLGPHRARVAPAALPVLPRNRHPHNESAPLPQEGGPMS